MSTGPAPPPTSPLRRLAQRSEAAGAAAEHDRAHRCDLCAEPTGERHHHLLDVSTQEVSCACPACAILFDHDGAGGGQHRLIRGRPRKMDRLTLDDVTWAGLEVPVDLAFFVRSGTSRQVTATYPNPAGLMRATVNAEVWAEIEETNPDLAAMDSDVQALLVNRLGGRRDHWLLPIDECYRLIALLRTHWTGFHGGTELWQRLDRYFEELPGGVPGSDRRKD